MTGPSLACPAGHSRPCAPPRRVGGARRAWCGRRLPSRRGNSLINLECQRAPPDTGAPLSTLSRSCLKTIRACLDNSIAAILVRRVHHAVKKMNEQRSRADKMQLSFKLAHVGDVICAPAKANAPGPPPPAPPRRPRQGPSAPRVEPIRRGRRYTGENFASDGKSRRRDHPCRCPHTPTPTPAHTRCTTPHTRPTPFTLPPSRSITRVSILNNYIE